MNLGAAGNVLVQDGLLVPGAMRPCQCSSREASGSPRPGLTGSGVTVTPPPSLVISYDLLRPDANTFALGYDVDFAVKGVRGNRIALGDYINRVQAARKQPVALRHDHHAGAADRQQAPDSRLSL